MRKKLSIINSFVGLINRVVVMIMSFVVRYFLSRYLLVDYLGLNGLFANILGILSLVDMGLGTAIAFSLYKPIHEKNNNMIYAIMKLYKKVYVSLGCIIFILSLSLVPFMEYIVNDSSIGLDYIRIAFILYAFGTALSYFFSYNRTFIFALQKNYIVQIIDLLSSMVCSVLQIIALVIFKNFLVYLIIQFSFTFISNLIITIYSKKILVLPTDKNYMLPKQYKAHLIKQVKALAVTNLCGKAITSTDNIIISAFVGIVDLARNSNYTLLITAVQTLVTTILGGATAAIGDLIAEGDREKEYFYFEKYYFMYFIAASFCSVCFYFLFDPFISIWVGSQYVFNSITKIIIVLNFYIIVTNQAISTFQNLAGFYVLYRNVSIVAAIINLAISIVLGMKIGIIGVFIGTTISYLYSMVLCNEILHKNLFFKNTKKYWYNQLQYFLSTILIIALISIIYIYLILTVR